MIDTAQLRCTRAISSIGFVTFDNSLPGHLRFTSLLPSFPLSIAYPAWSQAIVDLDSDGFGSVEFTGSLLIRRTRREDRVSSEGELQAHALDLHRERREVALGLNEALCGDIWNVDRQARPARLFPTILRSIPGLSGAGAIRWAVYEEICFVTREDIDAVWHVRRDTREMNVRTLANLLRSMSLLDRAWFSAIPAL